MHSEIVRLDEQGFAHRPSFHGLRLARMDYEFEATPTGTRYRNSLTVGATGPFGKLINPFIKRFMFDEARGRAWIKHNIEEVGNLRPFFPNSTKASVQTDFGTPSAGEDAAGERFPFTAIGAGP